VKDIVVGLIVEKIAEVVEITEDNILDSPSLGNEDKSQNKYVYAIGKVGDAVKLLLDPEKLIKDDDWTVLEQMAEELHTIPYEIICLISGRVTRKYIFHGETMDEENTRMIRSEVTRYI
jgi:hypothetical protein